MAVRPWTIKQAKPWVYEVHRRLPKIQGGLWAIKLVRDGAIVGCAIVAHAARELAKRDVLCVVRVAVLEGVPNGCSMLYGACSRAAKGMGAQGLVTYTHLDEPGTSLRASGWVHGGTTSGGEHDRPSRRRNKAVCAEPKNRWWAPWSKGVISGQ